VKSLAVGSLSRQALARCIGLINKALGGAMRFSRCDAFCTGWILIFSVITMDYTGLQIHIEILIHMWDVCRMQNGMPTTAKWSRLKPEVEFQYGGRVYFETGSSYISAANGDISTKFGLLIDFDLFVSLCHQVRTS